ncbi:MAG: PAS domain S-box protein [Chloroflexales bacterium]|nr:PAS domain S-box protein [Chloroflexales bacterium]
MARSHLKAKLQAAREHVAELERLLASQAGSGYKAGAEGDLAGAADSSTIGEAELWQPLSREQALRASEARYRLLADHTADVIWILDVGTMRFVYVSPSVEKLCGYTAAEVLAQTREEIIVPDNLAIVLTGLPQRIAAFASGMPGAVTQTHELEQRCKDGSTVWTEVVTTLHMVGDGTLHILGVTRDISERRRATEALRASEARYRVIFEGAKEGIIMISADGQTPYYVNPAMCAMFGCAPEAFMKLGFPDLHPPEVLPQVMAELQGLAQGAKMFMPNIACRRQDGTLFYADIRATKLDLEGAPCIIGFFQDITERRRSDVLLKARLQISDLAPDCSLETLMRTTIDVAEVVSGSQIGYFHFVDDDQVTITLQAWSTNTIEQVCAVEGQGRHYSLDQAGAWADALREKRPIIYNDYASLTHRKGMPEGHSALTRLISVPVQRNGHVVALIGLGNKPTAYDQQDLDAVALLANETWDIIMRKRAEAALRDSEERYRSLIESQETSITTLDADGVYHYLNRVAAAALGGTPEELVGRRMHDLLRPQTADLQLHHVHRVLAGEAGVVYEARGIVAGKPRWHRTSIQPIRNAQGQASLALVNVMDISERKEAELVLEERVRQRTAELEGIRQRLELATGAAGMGIWDWRIPSDELIWDEQMLKLYGLTRESFGGTSADYWRCLHPDDMAAQKEQGEAVLRGEYVYDSEFRVIWPDQSVHHLKVNALVLPGESGLPERLIGVNYDITMRKQAEIMLRRSEEALRQANSELERAMRMKDEFLASMSHELRTPLNGILGFSEALQDQTYGALNEKQSRALSYIESSGRHLLDLINDILDLSKIEAGKLELQVEACALDEICRTSVELIRGMAQKKQQQVDFSIGPAGISVQGDLRRLKQILVNLLSNAVKFTPEGGSLGLDVRGSAQDRTVRLTVWDTGIGIKQEDMHKLFQPFVQLDSSLSRQHSGTGLGLSLVRRLAELHDGSVQVESTPGEGSRFSVVLPWQPAPASRGRSEQHGGLVLLRRVMTVDDSAIDIERLTRYLATLGVEHVAHGQAWGALDRAIVVEPGVILLDLNLPDQSGWAVLAALKADARTRRIPVIITSVEENRRQAAALGAASSLVKPFTLADLRRELERAVASAPQGLSDLALPSQRATPLIMLVDDNEVNIEAMADYLKACSFTVVAARSGREALEHASEVRPDLVLMDIQMPGMDGFETIRRFRASPDAEIAAVPIIAVTALAMPGDRERCIASGADDYVSRPVRLREVARLIRELLQRKRGWADRLGALANGWSSQG